MGQTRSLCIVLALLLSQATVAYAADLGLPLYRLTNRLTSLDDVFVDQATTTPAPEVVV